MNTYRLLKDIDNPEYDKRCNYGHRKLPAYKAGTFFEGRKASRDDDGSFDPAHIFSPEWRFLTGDIAALIIGNSEPAEPSNWHEVATSNGGHHHFADDVLEQLIKDGLVTLEQVKVSLDKCLENCG